MIVVRRYIRLRFWCFAIPSQTIVWVLRNWQRLSIFHFLLLLLLLIWMKTIYLVDELFITIWYPNRWHSIFNRRKQKVGLCFVTYSIDRTWFKGLVLIRRCCGSIRSLSLDESDQNNLSGKLCASIRPTSFSPYWPRFWLLIRIERRLIACNVTWMTRKDQRIDCRERFTDLLKWHQMLFKQNLSFLSSISPSSASLLPINQRIIGQ